MGRTMRTQRFSSFLAAINLLLLICGLVQLHQIRRTASLGIVPVLRARALQIVDDRGRVRASIAVYPADPTVKMPDGTIGYPETVLLRLIDSRGGPNVKLAATERGAGLVL